MESDQSSNLDSGSMENNQEPLKTYTFLDGVLDLALLKPLLTKGSVILLKFEESRDFKTAEYMLTILEDDWWHYTNSPYAETLSDLYDIENFEKEFRITAKII